MSIKVAVVGATGRMGKLAIELIDAAQDLQLHAALDSKSELTEALGADVIFEVTRLEVSERVADFAIANDLKLVIGTSGWSAAKIAELQRKLESNSNAAVLVIPNFSIGSMLASSFAAQAAKFFDSIEIVEAHHAGKIDSPSGTAVRTAEMIADARKGLTQPLIPGVGQEARGEVVAGVPIHSIRLSGVSAKQDVVFGGESEVLTISHEVSSIRSYVHGILLSIRLAAQSRGLTVGLQSVVDASSQK
ncbi:4-hydroxy-tetrahydrodipicolinate reductase [Rhodoluna lacicola]|uniref:4-hydroxy-tetrahydrodipicolinate reductase n=1 Tax=Rhodoluna lacicola TaxID=529884 RepID=A0A060JL10_9MICO|nr:4-hydroxy-tetrahydrodipicolinate reductase [Rhodoluna lacicola]AIC47283.1 dihydrodipicolinate reductase [Rhodoluna lacicola]BDS50180.1 4-hydroxy-tetrahydrodipicolinate reductase [Rhodoluna lacicola]